MGTFVINLCAVAAAIWLIASFTHIIIAWNNFNETQKFNRMFAINHLIGGCLLLIAFTILWSVHIDLLISNRPLLEIVFMVLIAIGMPIVKLSIKRLYDDLKKYSEN
ncbi:hypothetical protein ACYATP_07825 [Lactobacillaceae bacterium Melli_B4]